jgi:hypothetical protein
MKLKARVTALEARQNATSGTNEGTKMRLFLGQFTTQELHRYAEIAERTDHHKQPFAAGDVLFVEDLQKKYGWNRYCGVEVVGCGNK